MATVAGFFARRAKKKNFKIFLKTPRSGNLPQSPPLLLGPKGPKLAEGERRSGVPSEARKKIK